MQGVLLGLGRRLKGYKIVKIVLNPSQFQSWLVLLLQVITLLLYLLYLDVSYHLNLIDCSMKLIPQVFLSFSLSFLFVSRLCLEFSPQSITTAIFVYYPLSFTRSILLPLLPRLWHSTLDPNSWFNQQWTFITISIHFLSQSLPIHLHLHMHLLLLWMSRFNDVNLPPRMLHHHSNRSMFLQCQSFLLPFLHLTVSLRTNYLNIYHLLHLIRFDYPSRINLRID